MVLLLALVVVSVITVKKRNIKLPTIASVRGLINPGYSRFDDGGMVRQKYFQQLILTGFYSYFQVSLKKLSSRENNEA